MPAVYRMHRAALGLCNRTRDQDRKDRRPDEDGRGTVYESEGGCVTMTRFTEGIREWFGWCPMAAAGKQEPAGRRMTVKPDKNTAGAGPVERRTALFLHLTLAVVGLSWIIGIAALPYLPETMPVHWNIYGEPDGFAGRLTGTFGLPAIITLVALLLVVLPRFNRMPVTFDESRDICTI